MMNDTSVKRIDQHLLTTASIEVARPPIPQVCAVVMIVVGAVLRPGPRPACTARCAATSADGLQRVYRYGGVRALWLRPTPACR